MLFTGNEHGRHTTEFPALEADWGAGFARSDGALRGFVVNGTPADMSPEYATKVLQLCFAVYRASESGTPVDPRTMTGSVTPSGWAEW